MDKLDFGVGLILIVVLGACVLLINSSPTAESNCVNMCDRVYMMYARECFNQSCIEYNFNRSECNISCYKAEVMRNGDS